MNILVLGANGMVGHLVGMYFKERGHDVTAFSRKPCEFCPHLVGDISDFDRLADLIAKGRYDAVVNAVGVLNQEAEDRKSLAVLLNSRLPHFLSELTSGMPTRIVQISTDCVFSGKRGGYLENDSRDGETFYDRSKALGELDNGKDLTFRNSLVGPDCNPSGIGLLNWFMQHKGPMYGYTRAIWNGVTTLVLAQAIERAVEEELTGIYHLVNHEPVSKFELLQLFNKHMVDDRHVILPNDLVAADKSLINSRTDFSFVVPSYEQMIAEMKEWVERHRSVYRHYFN